MKGLIMLEEYIGKVGKCSHNKVGLITGVKTDKNNKQFCVGKRVSDGKPWRSMNPEIVANSVDEYKAKDVVYQ